MTRMLAKDAAARARPIDYPAETRGLNFFELDVNLRRLLQCRAPEIMARHGERLSDFGVWTGGALDEQAAYTDRYAPPRLETYSRDGDPPGRVIYNPAYLDCHQEAYRRGIVGLCYGPDPAPHLLSFTMGYLLSHTDIAIHCPVTMTGALAYVLDRVAPAALCEAYLPELTRMDGAALSGGTWATEQHGGSDVGATTTEARPEGGAWRLTGLKWFTSNASCGLAFATARPQGAPTGGKGLGCYLVPDILPDGTANRTWVRRLKDKLGTRGLATGEVELDGAWALQVAGPPEGLKAMMEALEYSRVHNAVAAAGLQHRAFLEAVCWASHREAFGGLIRTYPMVRDSLLDLLTELEASTALAFEAALAFDAALSNEARRPWLRVATALAKHRTAEQAARATAQAVELVGGNGYTEDWPTARLYRDALVLPVWEGPTNIQALELLRMIAGKVDGDAAFLARIGEVLGKLPKGLAGEATVLDTARDTCAQAFAYLRDCPEEGPRHARRILDLMADTLAAALLLEEAGLDLQSGDARKALIARRYARARFGDRLAVGPGSDPAQEHFDAMVGFGAVPA